MGKALSGELFCPCDGSCICLFYFIFMLEQNIKSILNNFINKLLNFTELRPVLDLGIFVRNNLVNKISEEPLN